MQKYSVISSQSLTPTTLLLTLKKTDFNRPFSFQPGQYAAISFYRKHRPTAARCFSIVSSPTDQEILQFSMRTKGRFTGALKDLKQGDTVKVRGPFGGFVIESAHEPNVVLLAGGIGITPFMSMIRYATATQSASQIILVFSCAAQDDVPFLDELQALERQNRNFKVFFVIGNGPIDRLEGTKTISGRITPDIIRQVTGDSLTKQTYFICGPNPFMKAVTKSLQAQGVPQGQLLTEAFSQGPNRQTGKMRSWPLNIYFLGAMGMALGSFIVMVSDLLKTLPPSSIISTLKNNTAINLSNSRQKDLDSLVNNLPDLTSSAPVSPGAQTADAGLASTSQTSTSTPATTPTPTRTVPTPTPVAAPKCTTTASGVTTCV